MCDCHQSNSLIQPSQQVSCPSPQSRDLENCQKVNENDIIQSPTAPSNEYVLNIAFGSFLGFTAIQFVFALAASSQAMMTDCMAMAVDALTYLFNYFAERLKHRDYTDAEKALPLEIRLRKRKLHTLYLELFPPLISVTTLLVVTVLSLRDSIKRLVSPSSKLGSSDGSQPDLQIMLLFSGLNMILDIVNVGCFARVDQAIGLQSHKHHDNCCEQKGSIPTESSELLSHESSTQYTLTDNNNVVDDDDDNNAGYYNKNNNHDELSINLNMCSAWTHICADTLRSIAVILAAGFAALFPQALSAVQADSWAAIVVSLIILFSLGPLLQGLYATALQIREISRKKGVDNKGFIHATTHV